MDLENILPKRKIDAHKGDCGRVTIIGGSTSMMGAAILTSLSSLRTGAGLVYLMTVPEGSPHINIQYPEIIVQPLPAQEGYLGGNHVQFCVDMIQALKSDVVAIGPGLGRHPHTMTWVKKLIPLLADTTEIPLVVDADALFALDLETLEMLPSNRLILTPHVGEFNTLFDCAVSPEHDERKRHLERAIRLARQILILKGHRSLVGFRDQIYENDTGNPGMATAGSGDVLTGIIATLVSQKISLFDAAKAGVYLHAQAGDQVYEKKGNGLIASDIISEIPALLID